MPYNTSNVFWSRVKTGSDLGRPVIWAPVAKRVLVAGPSVDVSRRICILLAGLGYIGLFCFLLFMEVYVKTQLKSHSLELWTLNRRKAQTESEITRLSMRLTVLESPMRLETLASSEIGLIAAQPQKHSQNR